MDAEARTRTLAGLDAQLQQFEADVNHFKQGIAIIKAGIAILENPGEILEGDRKAKAMRKLRQSRTTLATKETELKEVENQLQRLKDNRIVYQALLESSHPLRTWSSVSRNPLERSMQHALDADGTLYRRVGRGRGYVVDRFEGADWKTVRAPRPAWLDAGRVTAV